MLTDFLQQQLSAVFADPQTAGRPLRQQLYLAVKAAIEVQVLRSGTRLPASRVLAEELGVARNTVLGAFSRLEAEGFVESRHGSGTYVRPLPATRLAPSRPLSPTVPRRVSARGARLLKQAMADELEVQPFTQGLPGAATSAIDTRRIRIPAADASWNGVIAWVERTQGAHGLTVESATIEALPAAGRVRAEIVVARP